MRGQYFKFYNQQTGETKEFFRKKGLTLSTIGELRRSGFELVEKIVINY